MRHISASCAKSGPANAKGPSVTAEELIEKAKDQRKRGRLEEALISARQASNLDSQSADAFWQVALCQIELGQAAKAVAPLEKVVEFAPRFARGWSRLGLVLLESGGTAKAKECLEKAVELDADEVDALVELAKLYELDKQSEEELGVLQALEAATDLTPYQLNRLGILHHDRKDFYLAIQYYRRVASASSGPAGLFNLGLAFNEPEVSQDADAIDAWRRAVARDPGYDRAEKKIVALMPKMKELRRKVQSQTKPLLDRDQWYSAYINPLELLRLEADLDLERLDTKTLQRAKKSLLQEIELEDGRVDWMPGLQLDRSRAIRLCDELNDPSLADHHYRVFRSPVLSGFLQRAELHHFLVDDDETPVALLEHIENDETGFVAWLSPLFSKQFNSTLTKAIEQRNVAAVECLLDGRRWVVPEDEDKCFEGSHRHVDRLLAPLRVAAEQSEAKKPTLPGIKALLSDGSVGDILGLLPVAFHKEQEEAMSLVRSISVDTHNHHDDPDLAKAILKLAEAFALKSPSLQHRLKEDQKTLDELIEAARRDEAHLTFGTSKFDITGDGAGYGERFIPVSEARTLRWGTIVTRENGSTSMTFSIAIGSVKGPEINVEWTSAKDHEVQRELFGKLVNASVTYLLPRIVESIQTDLDNRQRVRVGNVVLTREGVEFTTKEWIFIKKTVCPWSLLQSDIENGEVVISVSSDRKTNASLALHEVDNAVVLHFIAQAQRGAKQDGAELLTQRQFSPSAAFSHVGRLWFVYLLGGLILYGWLDSSTFEHSAPATKRYRSEPSARPESLTHIRSATAPNGQPWPASAGYIGGYPQLHQDGYSNVTIDNSRNESDVMVKLVSLDGGEAVPVRVVYIPARRQFQVDSVRQGNYDVRYKDLESGALSRSEPFRLDETITAGGVEYSTLTMTLFKVSNGNMQTYGLSESEF